jgi:hypothetical protein
MRSLRATGAIAAIGIITLTAALLTAGALVVPVVGPYAGLLLASGSPRWTAAQKTLVWILTTASTGFAAMFILLAATAVPNGFGLLLAYMAAVAGPAVSAFLLIQGLSRRT